MLNLDRIKGKRVAIHISTVEKSELFVSEMRQRFPEKIGDNIPADICDIRRYEGWNGFCYYPRFGEPQTMSFGDRATYDDWGVPVIEFEDLLVEDLVTNKSDMPIESLFV